MNINDISNQLSNTGMSSIYSVIYENSSTVIIQNNQMYQNTFGSFLKLTSSSIQLGECSQSLQCTSNNLMNILFLSSSGSLFHGSWTAFCPAFYIYETSPTKISITTKATTRATTRLAG
jgi:hypothetical protein